MWEWMILPLFALTGGLCFLVAVIVETRNKGMVPWTNNVLPFFFYGVDTRPKCKDFQESQLAMEDSARELLIEFQSHTARRT
jgi:hypothetical protein